MNLYLKICKVFFLILVIGQISYASGLKWREVSDKELKATPKVTANSDAEAIFREVRLNNNVPYKQSIKNYTRIKIYTDRGKDLFSTLEFPILGKLKNLGARVISPEGKITEIKESDFFDKELIKTRDFILRSKAAPIPNLEIGSILEFQYEENKGTSYSSYDNPYFLDFQWHIPVQQMTYIVKLNSIIDNWAMISVNMQNIPLKPDSSDSTFYKVSAENLLPFHKEVFIPPPSVVRKRIIIKKNKTKLDRNIPELWSSLSTIYSAHSSRIKKISKRKDTRKKAEQITANAKTDEDKIKLLFESIQKEIKNWQLDPNFTEEDRNNLQSNNPPIKMFKTKIGYSSEIDNLFAGLAKSLGFEVKLSLSSDRREYLFDGSNYNLSQYMRLIGCYIKINNEWRFFNPSNSFMKFGESYWYYTGNTQLLIDEKSWTTHNVPLISADENKVRRQATFTIDENGHLKGSIEINYREHKALEKRLEHKNLSVESIRERLLEGYKRLFKEVEITDLNVKETAAENSLYSISFNIQIENYAVKTDKRLIFQPAFFQNKMDPLFVYSKRIHPIYFSNPWTENDDITYVLPNDYKIEAIPSSKISDKNNNTSMVVNGIFDEDKNTLNYKRDFAFGQNGKILFSKDFYKEVKGLFDAYNKADSFSVSFIEK